MADISQIRLPSGDTFDLIDEKSGYITAQYIENKTDYSIPVSRVGEIVVGETAIGTDSTNFPTSKAVVDYVDERVVQEMDAIDLSNYATKATTLAGYGITDAKIQNGTITLGSNTITPLTSYTETDPVFSASPAAGITSTDISNWNAKVSDDKTWNGVSLDKREVSRNQYYIPGMYATTASSAELCKATSTPTARKIALYNANSYLISTTPSANDNSTKVATTAYVDSAVGGITVPTKTSDLTNDSGFITSYTDEKVKTVSVTNDGNARYLVFGSNTGNAETKYHSDALRYALLESDYALFSVGDNHHPGRIHIESGDRGTGHGVNLVTSATAGRTITFPDATGIVALTSDIPSVYSSTNTNGYLTMATLPIYDGTVE